MSLPKAFRAASMATILALAAGAASCEFPWLLWSDLDNPNDPMSDQFADYTIEVVAGIGAGPLSEPTALDLRLSEVRGLAVSGGYLYIADTQHHRVVRVDVGDGSAEAVAGTGVPGYSGDGGPAASARLFYPTAVAVGDDGTVYIQDYGNEAIRAVSPSGAISTYFDFQSMLPKFKYLASDRLHLGWNMYEGSLAVVADGLLVVYNSALFKLASAAGGIEASPFPDRDFAPTDGSGIEVIGVAAAPDGTLWIIYYDLNYQYLLGSIPVGQTDLEPTGRAIDSESGIAVYGDGRVLFEDDSGDLAVFDPDDGSVVAGPDFASVGAFCLDSSGTVYCCDWFGATVEREGDVAAFAGKADKTETATAAIGDFVDPYDLTLSADGSALYFTENSEQTVRRLDFGLRVVLISDSTSAPNPIAVTATSDGIAFYAYQSVYGFVEGGAVTVLYSGGNGIWDIEAGPSDGTYYLAGYTGDYYDPVGFVDLLSGGTRTRVAGGTGSLIIETMTSENAVGFNLGAVYDAAVSTDGTVYIAEYEGRLLALSDGVLTRVAGGIVDPFSASSFAEFDENQEHGPAIEAGLDSLDGIAHAPDGSHFIIGNDSMFRIGPDGNIEELRLHVGRDGFRLGNTTGIAVDASGCLYLAVGYQIIKATPKR